MSATLNKSKQFNGTPKANFKAQTPKSNKKRSLSPSNATPAAKTPKLEKFGGTKNLNVSNNSAKKQKKNAESTPSTPKVIGGVENKLNGSSAKKNSPKTPTDEERKAILQKIQELEQKPDKSKSAIKKLKQLKNRVGQNDTDVSVTESKQDAKKKTPKPAAKVNLQTKDEESSDEEESEEVNMEIGKQDIEGEDESDEDMSGDDDDVEGSDDDEDEEESDADEDSAVIGGDVANEDSDDDEDESDSNEDEVPLEVSSKSKVITKDPSKQKQNATTKNTAVVSAEGKANGKEETKYVMYVGNLDFSTTEEEIKEHFKLEDSITEVRFNLTFPAKKPTGNAFIEFKDSDSYEKALSLHQTTLKNRRITCLYTNNGNNTREIIALLNKHKGAPNNQGGNFQNRQGGGNFQNRQGGGNFQNRQGGNFQNRGGGNFQNRGGSNFQNRGGNNFQKGPRQNFNKGNGFQRNQNGNNRFSSGNDEN